VTGLTALSAEDQRLLDGLAGEAGAMVERAIAWAKISSGSHNLAGLSIMAAALMDAFAVLPASLARHALAPIEEIGPDGAPARRSLGEALLFTVRPEAPVQVALTGHYDTVYAADSSFRSVRRRADGALHGPGVADMKGGLSVMLAALAAFERHPAAARVGYRVLLSPDEEIGSPGSARLLAEIAAGAHLGMTYEPALSDGTLAAARKGSGNFQIVVAGRAAHAGRDFALGRNALAEAARIAAALDALNGAREGVDLNVARIDGGGPNNVVPGAAVVRFNVRSPDAAGCAWALAAIEAIVDQPRREGIAAVLHGGFTRPPKPFTPAQQRLFEALAQVGALIGLPVGWRASGGVCEGNNLYAAGLPNIDTLGVRGGDIHSEAEYAWPDSFAERAQLSALLLIKLAVGEVDARNLRAGMVGP
jgi:glutamate carboxypeptidase